MNIWFILMQFPAPREVFVNNDVEMLNRLGENISVHSLRPKHHRYKKLVVERRMTSLTHTHNSLNNTMFGLMFGLLNLKKFIAIISFIIKNHYSNSQHILKSLVLMPRVLQLFSIFEVERPDVVHLYWSHYPSMLGFLIKKYFPNTILTMNFVAYDLHQRYSGSYIVAQKANHIFSITKFDKSTLVDLGINEEKISTVYHGLLPEIFETKLKSKIKGRIISVGAFVPGKNMLDVVRTFALIQKKNPDVSLVLLGDGPLMPEAIKYVSNKRLTNVTFKGHVSNNEVINYLSEAEVFLFLSSNERLPNVIKEAMSQLCACVILDTPGIRELVKSDDYGIVLDELNLQKVCNAVNQILEDNSLFSTISENSYSFVKKQFNVEENIQQMRKIWRMGNN
jgi:glycosyltransferase involved in cell wall biosynthesis